MNQVTMMHSQANGFCFVVWNAEGAFVEQSPYFATGEACAAAMNAEQAKQYARDDEERMIDFYMEVTKPINETKKGNEMQTNKEIFDAIMAKRLSGEATIKAINDASQSLDHYRQLIGLYNAYKLDEVEQLRKQSIKNGTYGNGCYGRSWRGKIS